MNIQLFEAQCHDCCYSLNIEVKQNAEKTIHAFIEDARNADFLCQIVGQWTSPTTLFVLAEYFVKIALSERSFKGFNTMERRDTIQIVAGQCCTAEEMNILQQKCFYYQQIATLMCQTLMRVKEPHVQNSVCNLVGVLIQQIMMMSGQQFERLTTTMLQNFFAQSALIGIGLKLIQNIVINVQMYAYYDSYVSFRRIMSQVQFGEILSFLRILVGVLELRQPALLKPTIMCLKEVLCFNFNVSYFELETDFDSGEQNNVNFPDKFAEFFLSPILSQNLFSYVKEFINTDLQLALTTIKCLKRMVSARKRVFTEKSKRREYAKEMYQGAIYLFESLGPTAPDEVISEIMEFNNKLCVNFGLRQIRWNFQFSQNWLQAMQLFCITVLQKQIKIKDNHVKQMLEFMKRLVKFTIDFKLDPTFKQSIAKSIGEVGRAIIHLLLNSQTSFFAGYTPQNFKKLKHALKDFFDSLFPVLQLDLCQHLKLIYHSFSQIYQSPGQLEKLVIELSLINYVAINPSIQERQTNQSAELGQEGQQLVLTIIKDVVGFIRGQTTPALNPLIQMSVMSVAENLLQYSLCEIDDAIGRQRNQKQFFQQFIAGLQEYPNETTEVILRYICSTLTIEHKEIILYALSIIKETIQRLKHHMSQEQFLNLSIISMIKQMLMNLKNTALQKSQFLCCRTQSSEILAILLLDSAYENYINSIIAINELLQLQPTQESIEIYLYEMLGYFRYVDVSRIFRLLIKQHLSKITDLSNYILIRNPNQYNLCKLCLKLMVAVTENRNLRYVYHQSSIVQIELVRSFQSILAGYCNHLLDAVKDEKVKQDYSAQICRLIGLVFKVLNNVLKGKYISQACQLLFGDQKYLELLVVSLELASQNAQYITLYNKSCFQMVSVLQQVSASQLQLFEVNPQSLTKLVQIVEIIQKYLLGQLSEEYRTSNYTPYSQQSDRVTLDQTTDILANTLEFVSEEQQLAQLGMLQTFVQPLDNIIESILQDLVQCFLKGKCSAQTNTKITYQMFSILCTYQQVFVKIFQQLVFASQNINEELWRSLVKDLDLRIKSQNVDQFRKNLNQFLVGLNY